MNQRKQAMLGASFAVLQKSIPSDPPPIRKQIVQRRKVQAEYMVTPVKTGDVIMAGQGISTDELINSVKGLLANTTQVFLGYLVSMTVWTATADAEMNVSEHLTSLEASDNNRTKNSCPRVGFDYPQARRLAFSSTTTKITLADVAVRVVDTSPIMVTVQFLIDLALSERTTAGTHYRDGVLVKRLSDVRSLDSEMRDLRVAGSSNRPGAVVSPAPSFDIVSEQYECVDPNCGIERRHRHRVPVL